SPSDGPPADGVPRGATPLHRRRVRRAHVDVSAALPRPSGRCAARACAGRAHARDDRRAGVRGSARALAAAVGTVRPRGAARRRPRPLPRVGRCRGLPRDEHSRLLRALPGGAPARALVERRRSGRPRPAAELGRRDRHLGPPRLSATTRPAFYALAPGGWRDYVTLLHPPYTAWH